MLRWLRTQDVLLRSVALICAGLLLCGAGISLLVVLSNGTLVRLLTPRPPNATAQLQAFIPTAERFVEQHRGLRFLRPVRVELLDDRAFTRQVLGPPSGGGESAFDRRRDAILQALGLVQPGVSATQQQSTLQATSVIGIYDPGSKRLYVRGSRFDPEVERVVVHELTHALQDQRFGIHFPTVTTTDDGGEAYRGLLEGDAVRVERQFISSLSPDQHRELDRIESTQTAAPSSTPSALVRALQFPYIAGPTFVQTLLVAGGQSRLDSAFVDPPTATAEVLAPARYLEGFRPENVPTPTADGDVIDSGVLGALYLRSMLQAGVSAGRLDAAQADRAANAWAGDHYVAWSSGDHTCVRAEIATAGGSTGPILLSALQTYVSVRTGTSLEAGDPAMLTTCG